MTVPELLNASRAAHVRYRSLDLEQHLITPAKRAAIQEARDVRQQAHDADPDHADPAWALDTMASHAQLLQFYESVLSR